MNERFIRRKEVQELVGVSCSTLYRLMAAGEFPRPIKIGGVNSKSVGWPLSKVNRWIEQKTKEAEQSNQAA